MSGSRDLRVFEELDHSLGRLEGFDEPGPVEGQRVVDGFAAQDLVHPVVVDLGPGRLHAVGGVEPGQRGDPVDAAVVALDESFPADLLQEGELDVGPGLDVLGDVVEIIGGLELRELPAVGIDDPDVAVIELDLVAGVDQAHVVGLDLVGLADDEVDVGLVLEDDVVEDLEGELGELDGDPWPFPGT